MISGKLEVTVEDERRSPESRRRLLLREPSPTSLPLRRRQAVRGDLGLHAADVLKLSAILRSHRYHTEFEASQFPQPDPLYVSSHSQRAPLRSRFVTGLAMKITLANAEAALDEVQRDSDRLHSEELPRPSRTTSSRSEKRSRLCARSCTSTRRSETASPARGLRLRQQLLDPDRESADAQPVACQTALATAPAEPVMPISPTPLMPSAFTCGRPPRP